METQHSQLKADYAVSVTTDEETFLVFVTVEVRESDQYWQVDGRAKGQALYLVEEITGESVIDSDFVNIQAELLTYSY